MSLTAPERETVITLNDEDETAHVWTAQRKIITKLKKNPSALLLDEGKHDGSAWAEFEYPANLLSFRKKKTEQTLSQEEKERRGERMALARAAKG